MDHNALRSWHATMYKFVTSMVRCGLGRQQCPMHNATIQKTIFFELDVSLIELYDLALEVGLDWKKTVYSNLDLSFRWIKLAWSNFVTSFHWTGLY